MNTETKFGIIAAILCGIGIGFAIGYVGEDGVKANIKYKVENGKLVEA